MSPVESKPIVGQPRQTGPVFRSLVMLMWILGAFAAGIIVAHSRFDDPLVTQNGWFRLALLAGAIVLLLGSIKAFRTRLVLRLQVAIAASLLLHFMMVLGLRGGQLWLAHSDSLQDPQAVEQGPDEKWLLPDYAFDATTSTPNDAADIEPDETKSVDVALIEPAVRIAPLSAPEIEPTASAPRLVAETPEAPPVSSELLDPPPVETDEPLPSATASIDRQNTEPAATEAPPVEPSPLAAAPEISFAPAVAPDMASSPVRQSQPALPESSPAQTAVATPARPGDVDESLSPTEAGPLPDFAIDQGPAPSIPRVEVELAPDIDIPDAPVATPPQVAAASETPVVGPSANIADPINRVPAAVETPSLSTSSIPRNRPRPAAAEIADLPPTNTDQSLTPAAVGDVAAPDGVGGEVRSGVRRQTAPDDDADIPDGEFVDVPAVDAAANPVNQTSPSPPATTGRARRAPPTVNLDSAQSAPAGDSTARPRIAAAAPSPVDFDSGEASVSSSPAENSLASSNSMTTKLDRLAPLPLIDGRVGETAPAFRGRRQRQAGVKLGGGSPGSERAVELGLAFLSKLQLADGRWSLHDFGPALSKAPNAQLGRIQADSAATGLALLTYLGAGYTHRDGSYRTTVDRGLKSLLAQQKADGDLFAGGSPFAWLYSHGIATIALCEAYGMTRDPQLREPAQRAVNFIVGAQSRTLGGWRYVPRHESDTSVSGWQMMALKSGELAGLAVPPDTYRSLTRWLDVASSESDTGTHYAYMPSSKLEHQRQTTRAMTAEALLMRLYLGWRRDDPRVRLGVDFLAEGLPQYGKSRDQARDAYYWYYGTQVMFQVGGEAWETWNGAMRDLLVANQTTDQTWSGSWDPSRPVVDRWGIQAGRLYVTAMHLLMLEVYYRHLPLYNTLAD